MDKKFKNIDEIKLLRKSKLYIDALSQGINPLTGEYVDDSFINEEKIKNCFEYVDYVLGRVIAKGGISNIKNNNREKFRLTQEEASKIQFSYEPLGINRVAEIINAAVDLEKYRGITGAQLNNIFYEAGYLSLSPNGKSKRINDNSYSMDITTVERPSYNGGGIYTQIVYGLKAQKFVVDRLVENSRKDGNGNS